MKSKTQEEVQAWIITWLQDNAGITADAIDLDKPFADYHLDSITSIELSYDLEEFTGKKLDVTVAFNYPTINKMSAYLSDVKPTENTEEDLLTEIENMTEEEVAQHMRSV
jgi:acyl carrier protein